MKFIKLTSSLNNEPFWLRSRAIKSLYRKDDRTIVGLTAVRHVSVKESPEYIIRAVELKND
jgi:hypothetical protein